ncbi:hypothetical protein [Micromonospora purpureochromogenes]|uniref:Uncharacterized protein n=1 Tax=Micromonospora purpureochromogenes TaxID=47872 RepID=A0ABX2RK74_9ACTN|nr:hypothetical protein [Micromonospora purpureochromogenes]NYF56545.1 hypothetical protein [Micromonospora purpureochromogenes]
MRDVPEVASTPPVTLCGGAGPTDAGCAAPAEATREPGPTPAGDRRDTPFLPRSSRSRRI